jgi:hypothetical protein
VQTLLASLALHPHIGIVLLVKIQLDPLLYVESLFPGLAHLADSLSIRHHPFAAQTGLLNDRVLAQPRVQHFGHVDVPRVLAHKEHLLGGLEDRLENPNQRLLQLVLQVVVVVKRKVVLERIQWVF